LIRVLYLVSTLKRCGPTTQLYNIVRHLDRAEVDPVALTLSPEPADSLRPAFEALDLRVETLGLSRLAGTVLAAPTLRRRLAALKPDVLHSQGLRADALSAALDGCAPRIATVRNYPQIDYPSTYGRGLGWAMTRRHLQALRRVERCVAVSQAVAANLVTLGLPPTPVIANGVDCTRFRPAAPGEKPALRRRLDLPETARIWITVGHLSPRKDPITVIGSFLKRFGTAGSELLLMLGDGPLRAACRRLVGGAPNIRLLGRMEDVAPFLRASDYFVSASRAEGLPNAVLEAMASGLPLALSAIPPHEELLAHPASIGVAFRPNALPSALDRLAAMDRSTTAEAARRRAEDEFGPLHMARRYASLYDREITITVTTV
jgi:glycosyltransferase involved in cell wall biosynthesis